jgi:hypothetical protein
VINVLCEHSLINACADRASTNSPATVERAARDWQLGRTDSIARILNTGSYSTTSLSDIGSILAVVSAGSDSFVGPPTQSQFSEGLPAAPRDRYHHVQPLPAAGPATDATVTKDPREENATPNELPLAAAPARHDEEPFPPNQNVAVQTGSAIVQTPWSPSRRSPIDFLRLWGRSFAADARSTSRQFRRYAFLWNPLVATSRPGSAPRARSTAHSRFAHIRNPALAQPTL